MPSKAELREVAAVLAELLAKVRAGELDAPPGLVARLEAARRTVETIAAPERPGPTPRR